MQMVPTPRKQKMPTTFRLNKQEKDRTKTKEEENIEKKEVKKRNERINENEQRSFGNDR